MLDGPGQHSQPQFDRLAVCISSQPSQRLTSFSVAIAGGFKITRLVTRTHLASGEGPDIDISVHWFVSSRLPFKTREGLSAVTPNDIDAFLRCCQQVPHANTKFSTKMVRVNIGIKIVL